MMSDLFFPLVKLEFETEVVSVPKAWGLSFFLNYFFKIGPFHCVNLNRASSMS